MANNGDDETIYVPFVVEPQKYSDEQRVIDMFVMNDGKNLTPLEQAEGVRRMINYGYNNEEIARKIGRSAAHVSNLQLLNAAPKKMIKLIESNKVSATLAMDILRKDETDKFLADVEAGVYNGHTVSSEIFPSSSKDKKKITKRDLTSINSWSEFKRYAKNADHNIMDEEKSKFFKFLCRVMNNEMTEEQIKKWFK